jgi:hypothetical protein
MQTKRYSVWDFVPIVGSLRSIAKGTDDFMSGRPVRGLLNTAIGTAGLAVDFLTLGTGSLIAQGAKGASVGLGSLVTKCIVNGVATPVVDTTCNI